MKRRFILLWIGIALLVLFIFFYLPGISRVQELRLEEERLSKELADLDREIEALKEEKDLLKKDQAYLEKVIREELGLVRPGETVYKLVPEKKPGERPNTPSVIASPPEVDEAISNP